MSVNATSTKDYEYCGSFSVSQFSRIKSEAHLRHSLFVSWLNGCVSLRNDVDNDWSQIDSQQRMVTAILNNRTFIVVKDDAPQILKHTDPLYLGEPIRAMINDSDTNSMQTNVYQLFGHIQV